MGKAIKYFKKYILGTNWIKTIRVNFHYFPLMQALKFPVLVSHRVVLQQLRGGVNVEGPLTTGMMLFGYKGVGFIDAFYERTIWDISGTVTIKGKRIDIGRGSKFFISGNCYLGDMFSITGRSTIICRKSIIFGDNVLLSWDILVMDSDFHKIKDDNGVVINGDKPIKIGDNVWLGCRSTILKGCEIPSNSIIAAGSIISGKMRKEGCIYSSKLNILREKISWER